MQYVTCRIKINRTAWTLQRNLLISSGQVRVYGSFDASVLVCKRVCRIEPSQPVHSLTVTVYAENEHLLDRHECTKMNQVLVKLMSKGTVSELHTDLSHNNRLPILSLHSRLMVSSLDIISVNGIKEQHSNTHLAYTAGDGLSLRTFAAGDEIMVLGLVRSMESAPYVCNCC